MTPDFTGHLHKLEIPMVEMKNHQEQLRRELLTSPHWDRKPSLLSNLMFLMLSVRGGEKNMNYKRLAFAGLVVTLLMVGMFAMTRSSNSTVYAKEIAQKSMQTVSQLSAEKKLELSVPVNAETLLKEAQGARDLTMLTYNQVESTLPGGSESEVVTDCPEQGLTEAPEGSPEKGFVTCGKNIEEGLARLKQAKFLQYTRSRGEKVLLGIDQDNVAFFTSVSFGN